MEREVLVLIATIVWTLENVLPCLMVALAVSLLTGAALLVDRFIDKRRK